MRRLAALSAACLLIVGTALAQNSTTRVITRPEVPSAEALDRLGLQLAWSATVAPEGSRDRVSYAQLFGRQLFVQTLSGSLTAIDADTGRVQWRVRPGTSYNYQQPVAASEESVFAVVGTRMFSLKRSSGQVEWMLPLPTTPSAAPATDGDLLFIPLGSNRLAAYEIPARIKEKTVDTGFITTAKAPPPPRRAAEGSFRDESSAIAARASAPAGPVVTLSVNQRAPSLTVVGTVVPPFRLNTESTPTPSLAVLKTVNPPYNRLNSGSTPSLTVNPTFSDSRGREIETQSTASVPVQRWLYPSDFRIEQPPVVTGTRLVIPSTGRRVVVTPRQFFQLIGQYDTAAPVSAYLGRYAGSVFVPTGDGNLYAADAESGTSGRLLWRYTTGGPLGERPAVTDDGVFAVAENDGLHRIDRDRGDAIWRAPWIARFLAANSRFVYALDPQGRLVVLDANRGTRLSSMDMSAFNLGLINDQTDRVFLASEAGMIVCLFDRRSPAPVPVRAKEREAAPLPPTRPDEPKAEPKEFVPKEPKKDVPKKDKGDEMPKKDVPPKKG